MLCGTYTVGSQVCCAVCLLAASRLSGVMHAVLLRSAQCRISACHSQLAGCVLLCECVSNAVLCKSVSNAVLHDPPSGRLHTFAIHACQLQHAEGTCGESCPPLSAQWVVEPAACNQLAGCVGVAESLRAAGLAMNSCHMPAAAGTALQKAGTARVAMPQAAAAPVGHEQQHIVALTAQL